MNNKRETSSSDSNNFREKQQKIKEDEYNSFTKVIFRETTVENTCNEYEQVQDDMTEMEEHLQTFQEKLNAFVFKYSTALTYHMFALTFS